MNFADIDWVNDKFGAQIVPEKIVSVLSFSILWNLFEYKICDKHFDIEKVVQHVNTYNIPLDKFTKEINYFLKRSKSFSSEDDVIEYIEKGLLIPPLNKYGKENEWHTLVKSFLYEEAMSEQDKLKALFIIIYRLRNNMFHGEKDVMNIHLQEQNFIHANSAIKTMLSYL